MSEVEAVEEVVEAAVPQDKPRRKPRKKKQAEAPPLQEPVRQLSVIEAVSLLDEGIGEGDWDKVVAAYRALSGKDPTAPPCSSSNLAVAFLQDIAESIAHFIGSGPTPATVPAQRIQPAPRPQEPPRDREIRPAFSYRKMMCNRCGKTQEVHPAEVPRRVAPDDDAPAFVCNNCIVRQRRG